MTEPTQVTKRRGPGQAWINRRVTKYVQKPPTVRNAAAVIVSVTSVVVVLSAVAMRLIDAHEFPTLGVALWWAVQTATTVGYGDVTPARFGGRIVATVVMLEGVAFIAITTAVITSSFVARAQRILGAPPEIDELAKRLDRIEELLRSQGPDHPHGTMSASPGPD